MNMNVSFHSEQKVGRSFVFVLADGFSMHSLSNAIEPLTKLNRMVGKARYRWSIVTESRTNPVSACGFEIRAETLDAQIDPADTLIICDGINGADFYSRAVISRLRMHAAKGGCIGGIGNGVYALAQAGMLTNKRFTVHWKSKSPFIENYPLLDPSDNIYEIDRKLMTSGGGLAVMDMMLDLIARDFDETTSNKLAELCLHPGKRNNLDSQRAPLSAVLDTRNQILINVVRMMQENLEFPLDLNDIAKAQGVSRRQVERVFGKFLHRAPGTFYKELRLQRGRRLLHETDLSVTEIAYACGYNSHSHFCKNFKRLFDQAPIAVRDLSRLPQPESHDNQQKEKLS